MVRPIEISDSLSKVEAVQRMQQNQKTQPETVQQLQKAFAEKLTKKVTTPNPVPGGDQVVFHVDEQEEEKHKTSGKEESSAHEQSEDNREQSENNKEDDNNNPDDHIDVVA